MKQSVLRLAAENDIETAFIHYFHDASKIVAARFAELLDSHDLRSWILTGFPYTLFYVERENHVDIIRLLHQHSDIPIQLQDAT